jgi:hypothetical protein
LSKEAKYKKPVSVGQVACMGLEFEWYMMAFLICWLAFG